MLSRPPVHSFVPSWEMSMQLAPSVWPWNCLGRPGRGEGKPQGSTDCYADSCPREMPTLSQQNSKLWSTVPQGSFPTPLEHLSQGRDSHEVTGRRDSDPEALLHT